MRRTIKWRRDYSGREVEPLCNGKPLGALPQPGLGKLSSVTQEWSYKAGEVAPVEVLDGSDQRQYVFIDLTSGHTISEIPRDAFDFLD